MLTTKWGFSSSRKLRTFIETWSLEHSMAYTVAQLIMRK